MKTALITGVNGQDGAYLARHLVDQGYRVFGGYRKNSTKSFSALDYVELLTMPKNQNFVLVDFDILDQSRCLNIIKELRPDEVYNLAAQSFVSKSFKSPWVTFEANATGTLNLLEAIRIQSPECRFYQASTSEMFGAAKAPQNENTMFYPRSPYAVSKLAAHWLSINYREAYDIFTAQGILFNHESPIRDVQFVTRKICSNVAMLKLGLIESFELGNMDAKRDWGHAKDFVRGMHLMLTHEVGDTFVLATGQTNSVRTFLIKSLEALDIDVAFMGFGLKEKAIDLKTGKTIVSVNPDYFRPSEVDETRGDYTKARNQLNWRPEVSLDQLASEMTLADYDSLRSNGKTPRN